MSFQVISPYAATSGQIASYTNTISTCDASETSTTSLRVCANCKVCLVWQDIDTDVLRELEAEFFVCCVVLLLPKNMILNI